MTTTRADELLRKWAPGLYKAGGGAGWGDSMGVDSDLDTDTGVDDMDMSLGSSSCVLRRQDPDFAPRRFRGARTRSRWGEDDNGSCERR